MDIRDEVAELKVEIQVDEECSVPRIVIFTREITPEVNDLVRRLSDTQVGVIAGYRDDLVEILDPDDVCRFYSEQQKVFVQTADQVYQVRLRLYEIEERLSPSSFIRISNSEIVNFRKVRSLDLSYAGTICIHLAPGIQSFVSRRYVAKIKQFLGI